MKKYTSYVMRKKEGKYYVTRYVFADNGKLIERQWVNTYYSKADTKQFFDNLKELCEFHQWNILKEIYCLNIWEFQFC